MRSVMKLSSAEVELTLTQFEAQVIPDDHPLVPKLNELFGDHTFFLNGDGLNVVELNESTRAGVPMGTVVNLANWGDTRLTSLSPHEPEPTEVVVILERKH
jgi:hypothetical protein